MYVIKMGKKIKISEDYLKIFTNIKDGVKSTIITFFLYMV